MRWGWVGIVPLTIVIAKRLWRLRRQGRGSAVATLRRLPEQRLPSGTKRGVAGHGSVRWDLRRLTVLLSAAAVLLLVLELLELCSLLLELALGLLTLPHRLFGRADCSLTLRFHLDGLLRRSRNCPLRLHLLVLKLHPCVVEVGSSARPCRAALFGLLLGEREGEGTEELLLLECLLLRFGILVGERLAARVAASRHARQYGTGKHATRRHTPWQRKCTRERAR